MSELTGLRGRVSDKDLLDTYIETRPGEAEALGRLRGQVGDKNLLDTLIEIESDAGKTRSQVASEQDAALTKRKEDRTWGEATADLGRSFVRGAAQEMTDIGATLRAPTDGSKSLAAGASDAGGRSLQAGGDMLAQTVATPAQSQFKLFSPSTWGHYGDIPSIVAGSLPSIGGAALAAGAGGALGSIIPGAGTAAGAVGGAALYGYLRNHGRNANAHAAEAGRTAPTQADFDRTLAPTLGQAAFETATQRLGGAFRQGLGGQTVGGQLANPIAGRAADAAMMATGNGGSSLIGDFAATRDAVGGPRLDYQKALDAVGDGFVGAGGLKAMQSFGSGIGAARTRVATRGIDADRAGAIIEYMRSPEFDMNRGGTKKADAENAANLRKDLDQRMDIATRDLSIRRMKIDETTGEEVTGRSGIMPDERAALDQAIGRVKDGRALSPEQLGSLRERLGIPLDDAEIGNVARGLDQEGRLLFNGKLEAFNTIADRSTLNQMARVADAETTKTSVIGKAMRFGINQVPALGGAALGGVVAGLPTMVATGGLPAIGAGLGVKAGHWALGLDAASPTFGTVANRFAKTDSPFNAVMPASERLSLADQARLLQAKRATAEAPAPAPDAPHPSAPPVAPDVPVPQAPPHGSLNAALGNPDGFTGEVSFNGRPPMTMPPEAMGPGRMGIDSIMENIRAQAKAEGQPLLDVVGQHERSARSIAENPNVSAAERAAALAEAKAIGDIRKQLEPDYSPAEVARGRSARMQEEPVGQPLEVTVRPRKRTSK